VPAGHHKVKIADPELPFEVKRDSNKIKHMSKGFRICLDSYPNRKITAMILFFYIMGLYFLAPHTWFGPTYRESVSITLALIALLILVFNYTIERYEFVGFRKRKHNHKRDRRQVAINQGKLLYQNPRIIEVSHFKWSIFDPLGRYSVEQISLELFCQATSPENMSPLNTVVIAAALIDKTVNHFTNINMDKYDQIDLAQQATWTKVVALAAFKEQMLRMRHHDFPRA
jgi:hypothetical protein